MTDVKLNTCTNTSQATEIPLSNVQSFESKEQVRYRINQLLVSLEKYQRSTYHEDDSRSKKLHQQVEELKALADQQNSLILSKLPPEKSQQKYNVNTPDLTKLFLNASQPIKLPGNAIIIAHGPLSSGNFKIHPLNFVNNLQPSNTNAPTVVRNNVVAQTSIKVENGMPEETESDEDSSRQIKIEHIELPAPNLDCKEEIKPIINDQYQNHSVKLENQTIKIENPSPAFIDVQSLPQLQALPNTPIKFENSNPLLIDTKQSQSIQSGNSNAPVLKMQFFQQIATPITISSNPITVPSNQSITIPKNQSLSITSNQPITIPSTQSINVNNPQQLSIVNMQPLQQITRPFTISPQQSINIGNTRLPLTNLQQPNQRFITPIAAKNVTSTGTTNSPVLLIKQNWLITPPTQAQQTYTSATAQTAQLIPTSQLNDNNNIQVIYPTNNVNTMNFN